MPSLKYLTRVVKGIRFDKLNRTMTLVKERSGHSKVRTFFSLLWCAARYGAGHHDYVMFGFYDMNGRQRNTYLTRIRNKKVCETLNDYTFVNEFDDKNRFNERFSEFLLRKTVNTEACTLEEFKAFLEGLDIIFAKPNHSDSGKGIEKIKVADHPDAEELLQYLRGKKLSIAEEAIRQHPDMARLHPSSVNSLRIVTDFVDDTVHVAYITVKMGRGDCFCDNNGQGGLFCRVDMQTGDICSVASDVDLRDYEKHPDTGVTFVGYRLPMIPEAIKLVKKAARVVPQMRHIGWDVAITPDGPAIIEGNEYPGTDLCQFASHYPEKCGLWPYYKKLLKL